MSQLKRMLVNVCFQTAQDIQSPVMSCWSAIGLVTVTRDKKSYIQPGNILLKKKLTFYQFPYQII